MSLLYEPPPGYYDLPFSWVFDGSQLIDTSNALNQTVPIYAGYGDFIMRRIVGLDNLLKSGFTGGAAGQFQIRDALGRYLQSQPQSIGRFLAIVDYSDIAMSRDMLYQENSSIKFDLYNVLRAVRFGQTYQAQIAFQGVRRLAGVSPWASSFKYNPKTFTYTVEALLPVAGTTYFPTVVNLQVQDYDFELFEIRICYSPNASFNLALAGLNAGMIFYSQLAGTAGAGTQVILAKTAVPNSPLTVFTTATAVTVTGATDSLGNTITNGFDIFNAINGDPSASQLILVTNLVNGGGGYTPATLTLVGGGAVDNTPSSLVQLYDQNGVVCQSQPMLDSYINGSPNTQLYINGALVPPLLYRQNSRIRMDVTNYNNITPTTILIEYVGRQRIPC